LETPSTAGHPRRVVRREDRRQEDPCLADPCPADPCPADPYREAIPPMGAFRGILPMGGRLQAHRTLPGGRPQGRETRPRFDHASALRRRGPPAGPPRRKAVSRAFSSCTSPGNGAKLQTSSILPTHGGFYRQHCLSPNELGVGDTLFNPRTSARFRTFADRAELAHCRGVYHTSRDRLGEGREAVCRFPVQCR